MLRVAMVLLIINFCDPAFSSPKDGIISQMKLTKTLSFNFIQSIDEKKENGSCIIKYPKKIFCEYKGANEKVIVSNGKSLVIKIKKNGNYYIYPLNKTPLELLLDKEYLISKINTLEPRDIDGQFLAYKIFQNENEINIFFDKKTLDLQGWEITDQYNNSINFSLKIITKNDVYKKEIFKIPDIN